MTENAIPPQPRLLLCDDSALERHALAQFLQQNGFQIEEARDGDSAIDHVKRRPVDLVVLDLNMPGSDGFKALGYLQEHRPLLPVILISGMPLNTIQHKMHVLPTRELPPLLIKPIDLQQLLGLLDLQLSGALTIHRPIDPPAGSSEDHPN